MLNLETVLKYHIVNNAKCMTNIYCFDKKVLKDLNEINISMKTNTFS